MACASALGSVTGTPVCSMGAATMKMIISTNMTSTSGVTLISEIMPLPPPPDDMPIALPQEVTFDDVEKVIRERVHLRRQHLDLAGEEVERHDRRHRGHQAHGGGAERF